MGRGGEALEWCSGRPCKGGFFMVSVMLRSFGGGEPSVPEVVRLRGLEG